MTQIESHVVTKQFMVSDLNDDNTDDEFKGDDDSTEFEFDFDQDELQQHKAFPRQVGAYKHFCKWNEHNFTFFAARITDAGWITGQLPSPWAVVHF